MSSDVRQLRRAITRWGADVHDQAVDTVVRNLPPYAPIGTGPKRGELRRSITRKRISATIAGERFRGHVVAPVIQATTTDKGSPPHEIRPRRAGGLLVFYWPKAGRRVFLRSVQHPGNAAKPWWERGLRATWGPALRFAAVHTRLRR